MKGFVDHYKVTEVLKLQRKDNHKIIAEQPQLVHWRHKKTRRVRRAFYEEKKCSVKERCQAQHSWWQPC